MSYKSKTNKSATEHASLNPKTGLNASGQQMGKGKRSGQKLKVVFRGGRSKSRVHAWREAAVHPHLSSPQFLFVIFLGSVLHVGSIHLFPSFQLAKNIIHMLRCLAPYRSQRDVHVCFISTYMPWANVRIPVKAASSLSQFVKRYCRNLG